MMEEAIKQIMLYFAGALLIFFGVAGVCLTMFSSQLSQQEEINEQNGKNAGTEHNSVSDTVRQD